MSHSSPSLAPPEHPSVDRAFVAYILAFIAFAALAIGQAVDLRQSALFLIGGALGLTLFHAAFGFAGGWRRLVVERRGRALRAQMLMIAVAALVFIPVLAVDELPGGRQLAGSFAPLGVSVMVGALLFGIGMQLGGGCGSGTLFAIGGGQPRLLLTLIFFVAGSLAGTAHLPWWLTLPSLPAVDLGRSLGVLSAILITLAGLGSVAGFSVWIERRRHATLEAAPVRLPGAWLTGPWSLITGALLLAGLNILTLWVAGHPWSITYAFGLWGAKGAQALGVAVADWEFWNWPMPSRSLHGSILADITSVMNFGIVLGAALAAGLSGRFAHANERIPLPALAAAVIGGLLMGYGARLSFGCNIGALFSGIASGSAHGWLWFALAFAGSVVGIYLRPLFALDTERKS